MTGFVYRWINRTNGMMYIGSHCGRIDDGYIGGGVYFIRAYNKNPNRFFREIVYQGDNYRAVEEKLLLKFDCANQKCYYNLKNSAIGGDTYSYASEDVKKRIAHGRGGGGGYHNIKDKDSWLKNVRKSQECELLRQGRRERMIGKTYSKRYDLNTVWDEIKELYLQGLTYKQINALTGYSRGTIYRAKQKNSQL